MKNVPKCASYDQAIQEFRRTDSVEDFSKRRAALSDMSTFCWAVFERACKDMSSNTNTNPTIPSDQNNSDDAVTFDGEMFEEQPEEDAEDGMENFREAECDEVLGEEDIDDIPYGEAAKAFMNLVMENSLSQNSTGAFDMECPLCKDDPTLDENIEGRPYQVRKYVKTGMFSAHKQSRSKHSLTKQTTLSSALYALNVKRSSQQERQHQVGQM